MAETIVNSVLRMLADKVYQEAVFLYGVSDKVKRVQRELTWIQAFLKDADTKRHKSETVKKWVNEVQEVGFLIEGVLEKILDEVGGGSRPEGLRNTLKRIGKMPMKPFAKHKLGKEIDKINQRLHEIDENKKKFGIEGLEATSSGASVEQPIGLSIHPDIDDLEVVGFEVERKTIVDELIDANITRRSVISIVGTGGSGKTTLAKMVYKSAEVKRHFDMSIWLTISQECKLIDILMKILKEIGRVNSEMRNEGEEYLTREINKSLRERKYLVLLDDVWPKNNIWTQLQAAIPNANNGSRVLITTRFIEIAKVADKMSKPYHIKPLKEEESKQLFLKKVFPNQYAKKCPNDDLLRDLATKFTKKCGGWPLPLVVVGGILSRKNPDYITWDEVMQKIDWHIDDSNFMGVISTSYEDFPTTLKPCFMYFGVFPEDYQIKATTLIQLWIAEGLIPPNGKRLLEDIAESYLEELVQRCMVQVSKISCIGKIKYCHIHDLLRDLAIQKAKESNFLTVVSKNDTSLSCSTCARRVALHGYGDKMIEHACKKKIRYVINFGDVPNFNKFGMLRILHMSTVSDEYLYGTNCLKGLNALTALKYFGLELHFRFNKKCKFPAVRFFKRSPLTYMKNLQTVHTWFCKSHGELPPSFWGNKQLRHINLSCCRECKATPEGPPSAADLPSLLILKGVTAGQDWVTKLPKFPCLRKLGIVIPEDVVGERLMNSLSDLNDLGSLYLKMAGNNCQMTFPDCISAFRNHNRLHSFSLWEGRWPRKEIGDCTLFPPRLVKLVLWRFNFEEDPMPQLEKLPNLKVLKLDGKIDAANGKQMICSRGGFGRLQRLIFNLEEWKIEEDAMPNLNQLFILNLKEWKIEGAMPNLNQLFLICTEELETVPDLQYLVNLQELTVMCSPEFETRLKGEEQWKIKHIPSVIIRKPLSTQFMC